MGQPETESLSKDLVVQTAIALADRHGLDWLSMRKLADELGAGAMSLYYYVPNREELVDEMIDVVFGEIEPPPLGIDWRTAMRRRAVSTREALNRHRWAVGLMEGRAKVGPNSIQLREAILGCLRQAGFSVAMTVQAYSVQDAYIYGFALQEKGLPFESAEESTEVAEATTQQVAELAENFPYLAEVVAGHVATVGYDFGQSFEFGLDLILDALDEQRDEPAP
ncbi:MAG TPA: TetR/AcrR family transcriptional regulator [Solirubrobacteraceae bacterium]|nr:TetR/AcrR family transcriptional regulator [Solirubrobacteraceae bacterium]